MRPNQIKKGARPKANEPIKRMIVRVRTIADMIGARHDRIEDGND